MEDSSCGVRSVGESAGVVGNSTRRYPTRYTTRDIFKLCVGLTQRVLRNKEAQNPTLFGRMDIRLSLEAMWKSVGKTALFATVSLQKRVSMRAAMEHKYPSIQFILTCPRWKLGGPDRRGRTLARRSKHRDTHEGQVGGPESKKLDLAKGLSCKWRTRSPSPYYVWEPSTCFFKQVYGESSKTRRQADGQSQRRSTKQGINTKLFDCEFIVNPGFISARLLATIKQHLSSTPDDIRQECIPETFSHERVGRHRQAAHHDDLRIQHTQELCDYAARFRPSYLIFVRLGSGKHLEVSQEADRRSERKLGPKGFTDSLHIKRI